MRKLRIGVALGLVLTLGIGFVGGFNYEKQQVAKKADAIIKQVINKDQPGGSGEAVDFSLFWQVWDKLQSNYVDKNKVDTQKMVYGAIEGMVNSVGDPYTVFFEPAPSAAFQEQVSGAFAGVGMEIGMKNNAITVIAPIKDSPAAAAGVLTGDQVVKVDGVSTANWTVDAAVAKIRGDKGTKVTITFVRSGVAKPFDLTITRDTIKIPAIDWKLIDGHIAYLQLYQFNGNLIDEFAKASNEILASGADRLVLDLREDPGGLLDSAVNVAGWMLPNGSLVVEERYGNGTSDKQNTSGNNKLGKLPTVVLIDGGSASAAEILAGALHDQRNIPLVGVKSFGKGSVQQLEDFYNGSSLKVTIAKWYTPSGVNISAVGINPTVEVKLDMTDPSSKSWQLGVQGKDPQLDKALEVVKALQ